MRKPILFILCAALILAVAGCSAPQSSTTASAPAQSTASSAPTSSVSSTPTGPKQYIVTASIDSKCLKDNLINVSTKKSMCIYLPPSYYDNDKYYPVVYYLHGHGENASGYIMACKGALDKAFKAGAKEFIFVGIDGGTSFYVNSPVTGNWEDYFLTEIIPYVDANFRTIPKPESRGISGFSMGGFGSINLALKHPDIFSAVYSMSPGLLKDDGLSEAMGTWKGDPGFLRDYSRAFAPDTSAENLGDIPKIDGSDADNAIVKKWMSGFGDLQQKMEAYKALKKPLKAIGFSYGTGDSYTWIPKGTQYFSDLLKENGIENSLYTFSGGHVHPTNAIPQLIVPLFEQSLVFEN